MVGGRIAQLRAQAKAEAESKISPKKKAPPGGGDGRAGLQAPAEYDEIDTTALEEDLRVLVLGPDDSWLEEAPDRGVVDVDHACPQEPRAQERLRLAQQLKDSGLLQDYPTASAHLQSHLAAHALLMMEQGRTPEPRDLLPRLEDASRSGSRLLAREAEGLLLKLDPQRDHRAGDGPHQDVEFGLSHWGDHHGCWRSAAKVSGQTWELLDYRDKLPLPPDLSQALGLIDDAPEEKQCLCLHLAAAVLRAELRGAPIPAAVADKAAELRQVLWDGAVDALKILGEPPPWITQHEQEVRMHIHDALHPNHHNNNRCFQIFPSSALASRPVHVWRVSRWGRLDIDVLRHPTCDETLEPVVVIISRRHMRVAVPASESSPSELLCEWNARG